jgi:hypothetical protein
VARRELLNDPVRLRERAPDILICAAARPTKLARAATPNGGFVHSQSLELIDGTWPAGESNN